VVAEELRRFLSVVADDRLFAMWVLLCTTGLRRGEVLGLRWRDVDLEARRVSVCQTLVDVRYEVQVSEPKTAWGRRPVALDPITTAALVAHRERQRAERLMLLGVDESADYVFTQLDGHSLQPQNMSQAFENIVRRAGLPTIRLHDLRHSAASLALAAGIHPKVVSERLGHANIQITLDTYSHVVAGLQDDAADRMAALIFDTSASTRSTEVSTPPSTSQVKAVEEPLVRGLPSNAERGADVSPSTPVPAIEIDVNASEAM
jgi:integrase